MAREFPEHPIVGVGAVVLRHTESAALEVLLVRRANPPLQGEWSLPGGMVELGERLEAAIVREVQEETGLTVRPLAVAEVLDSIVHDNNPASGFTEDPLAVRTGTSSKIRFHYVLIDYVCEVTGGLLASSSDASAVAWQSVRDIRQDGPFALQAKTIAVIQKAASMMEAFDRKGSQA